jgi:molybdopterin/thiamine biosynthesis adenylyltransferase
MKKVKVKITEEEWYPLYDINTNRTYTVMKVFIPENKKEWIKKTMKEFIKVQRYLNKITNIEYARREK